MFLAGWQKEHEDHIRRWPKRDQWMSLMYGKEGVTRVGKSRGVVSHEVCAKKRNMWENKGSSGGQTRSRNIL